MKLTYLRKLKLKKLTLKTILAKKLRGLENIKYQWQRHKKCLEKKRKYNI